jgi:hypothetical protein
MPRLPLVLSLALLSGCAQLSQVAKFTAADAANAAAMAKAQSADPQSASRASCYAAWAGLASGLAAVPSTDLGLFTGVEAGIEVQATLQLPACQAIAGQVLLWGLRRAPGGNLLP